MLHKLIVPVVFGLWPYNAAFAQNVTTFTLENGLEAVVIEDHRAPVVTHMLWYRTGSADEPEGKSGIAHYLEHLMFKGTDAVPGGQFSATVEEQGGADNAFTNYDYTGYFQRVASDRLELMMTMEADRMRGLILSEDNVETERDVIIEERAQRVDSLPSELLSEQSRAAQYLNHRYGVPIIGWKHEIETLTRDDALEFYRTFYAPNNAVLVVAGDVDPDAVKAMAEAHYGPIAPTPDLAPRQRPSEPPQMAERRLIMADARVGEPNFTRIYLATERNSGAQDTAAALTILAEILGGSDTSVLARALQIGDDAKAVRTNVYYEGLALDATEFNIVATPRPDVSLAELEAALDEVIATFLVDGIDQNAFERIKRQLRADEIYASDSASGLADKYGSALTSGLTVADVQAWPEVLQAVTPEDVLIAARDVLDRNQAVTGWLIQDDEIETEVHQ